MQEPRFISIEQRKRDTILYSFENFLRNYALKIKHSKWNYSKWKGLTLMKDPMTLSIYSNLLQELKPRTIIEFGTYDGGSALWLHDMMKMLGQRCKIHTFDVNAQRVALPEESTIEFHQFNNYQVNETTFQTIFSNLEHPVLVIEDSHVNIIELLNNVDTYLLPGDYLIVEDTLSRVKYKELCLFLDNKNYLVDQYYCDLWGYNNSWNLNSFLKKVG